MSFFDQENNGAECFFDQENNGAECFFDTQKSPEPGPVPGKFWPVPNILSYLLLLILICIDLVFFIFIF